MRNIETLATKTGPDDAGLRTYPKRNCQIIQYDNF